MSGLPSGTVTFVFTDIEGSTRILRRLGNEYGVVLEDHRRLLRNALAPHGGVEVTTEGDGFFAVFDRAVDALAACLDAQLLINAHPWPEGGEVRVRMGLHTGEAISSTEDYAGLAVHQAARIASCGHGGQVLVSDVTQHLVSGALAPDASLADLGEHRLKDFDAPQRLYQLCHPSLTAQFPPLRTEAVVKTNLPLARTSFVGRDQETTEVKKLLATTPLLTVAGPGGAGKTRIVLQVATDLVDDYPDGVWLVELASVADPSLIAYALASSLRIREQPGRELIDTVIAALRSTEVLVVLDNCEHLVEACAGLVETLLVACPGLTVLATSREPLGVGGESIWRIPALPTPDATRTIPVEALLQYDAVRLFVERAQCQSPTFALTHDNADAVAHICRRLDGLPLAIELAAARTRMLSAGQIAERLDDRFRLLTGGARTSVHRQQTLRALVEWSYDLLSPDEQGLWRALSVFPSSFTLESAERICAGESVEAYEFLDQLAQLVDKSIVVVHDRPGDARYSMFETLRQYGNEQLELAGEAGVFRRAHTLHFLQLAEQLDALEGPSAAARLGVLEAEHDSLRVALEWSLAVADMMVASRLALALTPVFLRVGRVSEVEPLANTLLAFRLEPHVEIALRRSVGEALWVRGHMAAAIAALEAAAAVDGAPEAARVAPLALAANIRLFLGDVDRARAQAEQALTSGERLGDDLGTCVALQTLSIAADARGQVTEAVDLARRAVDVAARCRQPHAGYLYPHLYLGLVLLDADRFDEAVTVLEAGRRMGEEQGNVLWLPLYHWALGMIRVLAGEFDDGVAQINEGLDVATTVGTRLHVGFLHGSLAWVGLGRGDLVAVHAALADAVDEVVATAAATWRSEAEKDVIAAGPLWPVEWGLWLMGLLCEARGSIDEAASLLEQAWVLAAPLRCFLSYRLFGPDVVRLALETGNRELAVKVTTGVEDAAARATAPSSKGAALRCRGMVEADAEVLLRSVDAYRRSPRRLELAFACEDAGAALARHGRNVEAVNVLNQALEIYERAGAHRHADRARAALEPLRQDRR